MYIRMSFNRPDPKNNLSSKDYERYLNLRPLFTNTDVYTAPPTEEEVKEYNDLLELAKTPKPISSGGRRTKSSKKRPTARRRRRSSKSRSTRRR